MGCYAFERRPMPVSSSYSYRVVSFAMQQIAHPVSSCTHNHTSHLPLIPYLLNLEITPPILPPRPPPLLPLLTIKLLLPQLLIHSIMRLAHPLPKLVPRTDSRCVLLHPLLEVFGAHPAWVQFAKCGEEGFGFGLQLGRWVRGVCAGYRVEEGP